VAGCAHVRAVEIVDASAARPVRQVVLETIERLTISFRVDFDPAIREIANPAVKTFEGRLPVHEVAKAHSLYTTTD